MGPEDLKVSNGYREIPDPPQDFVQTFFGETSYERNIVFQERLRSWYEFYAKGTFFNVGETGLSCRVLPDKIMCSKNENSLREIFSKERQTVMLCVSRLDVI